MKALAWFFVIVGIYTIVVVALNSRNSQSPQPLPSPGQGVAEKEKEAEDKEEDNVLRAVVGVKQLQAAMRNPDSFKLSQALIMEDGAVCYEYRAQNGFGGMNVGQAVLAPNGQLKSDESSGFARLWNKECANKRGVDKSQVVGGAAGLHGMFDK